MPDKADIPDVLDELNRKQRQNVNKGWMVVIATESESVSPSNNARSSKDIALPSGKRKRTHSGTHAYVRRKTLMETLHHQIAVDETKARHQDLGDVHERKEDTMEE
eukprot:411198_1